MVANIDWASMNPFRERQQQQEPLKKDNTKVDDNNDDPNKKVTNTGGQGDDPMLKFDSLWQPNVDAQGKPVQNDTTQDGPYLPALDPKKFGQMVEGMDFARGIAADDWKAIGEGGEGAVAAMAKIINHVGRQSFKHSFAASTRLAEAGFSNAKTRFSGEIPNHVRDLVLENELGNDPIMKNPAFAPVVKQVKNQYLAKFPKATPAELNNAVKQYFAYMAKELNTNPNKDQTVDSNAAKLRKGAGDADFMEWLGAEIGPNANQQPTDDDLQQQ